ncbi:DUF5327 family protein [Lacicoccus alkaliphilus]|uniref:YwdI family protein n=1 Tax=Lacicoccus alkaliphilus DSM 16010 TaxID=1123231 RepID=A0A1M7HZM4_9BACL|nr:DUF5327 family protein [Salinicoccus alkaliphilus]SHM33910.1 hypothetical protein SAMN02745189_01980 [Salinicoccus alkaliphilus DSM 16010]
MKRQIIQQIKSELHMLEVSSRPGEFEKHLYTIETLVGILKAQPEDDRKAGRIQEEAAGPGLTDKDKRMLELMGGSQDEGAPRENKRTDESIFDF